ncbi:MAG: cadherin-like domain-containing protein, partial [Burkholderiaceae bacterium]
MTQAEDTSVVIDPRTNDTDPDNNPLTVTSVNGIPLTTGTPVTVSNGSVVRLPDGSLQFTPTNNFNGPTSFNYTIDDGFGGTDTALVNLSITPVNDAPQAIADTVSTLEDTPVNIDVQNNDFEPDGDAITTIRVNGTALFLGSPLPVNNGTVSLQADGSLTFTPASNFNG